MHRLKMATSSTLTIVEVLQGKEKRREVVGLVVSADEL